MIRSFPEGMHPMTQLSSAILALQTESVFAQKYAEGTNKTLYWAPRSPRPTGSAIGSATRQSRARTRSRASTAGATAS